MTDSSLLTLAKLGGVNCGVPTCDDEDDSENPYGAILEALAELRRSEGCGNASDEGGDAGDEEEEEDMEAHSSAEGSGDSAQGDADGEGGCGGYYSGGGADETRYTRGNSNTTTHACVGGEPRGSIYKMLARGKRDNRMSIVPTAQDEEEEEVGDDVQKKEAMKVLCNVVYNSIWAQERASELRYLLSR